MGKMRVPSCVTCDCVKSIPSVVNWNRRLYCDHPATPKESASDGFLRNNNPPARAPKWCPRREKQNEADNVQHDNL